MLELTTKELASVHKTDSDPDNQRKRFKEIYTNMEGTVLFIDKYTKEAVTKRATVLKEYMNLLLYKLKFAVYEYYSEEYMFKLNKVYDIIDGEEATGSSLWEFTNKNTLGHDNAIA